MLKFAFVALAFATLFAASANDSIRLRYPEQIQHKKLLDRQKVFTPGGNDLSADSIRTLMDIYYLNQFHSANDPEAPYFMLMSKDAHLAMGVGGIVRVRAWEDWNGVVEPYIFSPYNIPIPKNPARMKRIYATAANSVVYLTLLGRKTPVGDFMAYLEGGFSGYNRMDFKLRRAYIMLHGFTAGYALSTFLDVGALPRVCDGGITTGSVDRANILIRYQHNFKSNWSVAGGIEFPQTYIAADGVTTEASLPYLPDFAAFGQYKWNEGYSHVRLSGLLRTLSYRNLLEGKNHTKIGWGIALSTGLKIIPNLTLYGIATYGAGDSSYLSDMSNGEHDLIGIQDAPGQMEMPKVFSYFTGFKYNFRPDIYSTIMFSATHNYESQPPQPDSYRYGLLGAVNLFWEITPRLSIGGEYIIGKRKNFDGASGVSNRAEAMFQLSF